MARTFIFSTQILHVRRSMVGTGITIWAFGILFLLLGWAQHMRQVRDASLTLLVIGAVLFVVGGLIALAGKSKQKTR